MSSVLKDGLIRRSVTILITCRALRNLPLLHEEEGMKLGKLAPCLPNLNE